MSTDDSSGGEWTPGDNLENMVEESRRLDPWEWDAQDAKVLGVSYLLEWRLEEEAAGRLRQADDDKLDDFIVPDNEDRDEGKAEDNYIDSNGSSIEIVYANVGKEEKKSESNKGSSNSNYEEDGKEEEDDDYTDRDGSSIDIGYDNIKTRTRIIATRNETMMATL